MKFQGHPVHFKSHPMSAIKMFKISVFATTTTAAATSPFGGPAAPATQQSTTGSFGFGSLNMGASGASSGSIFGGTSGKGFFI